MLFAMWLLWLFSWENNDFCYYNREIWLNNRYLLVYEMVLFQKSVQPSQMVLPLWMFLVHVLHVDYSSFI